MVHVKLVCGVIFILDRKYGSILTNYKVTYLLFEVVNLVAVITVIVYEYTKHTEILNLFLNIRKNTDLIV